MTADVPQPQSDTQTIAHLMEDALNCHRAGDLLGAGQRYQRILQSQPGHAEANHKLGLIAVEAQQAAAGLPYFAAALEADPTRAQYWIGYIDALDRAGQTEDARTMLAQAQQQGLEGEAVDVLAARIGRAPSGDELPEGPVAPPGIVDATVKLFQAGRHADVVAHARALTGRYPEDAFGWKILGVALQLLGRGEEALDPLLQAAARLPDDAEAHCNAAIVLQAHGRVDEAETCYRHALRIDPDCADASLNLGVLYNAQGRSGEAEAAFRDALRSRPDYAEAHANLGGVLQALDQLDEAETHCRRALELAPDNPMALNNFGIVLQRQGRLDEAAVHFQSALARLPGFAAAHRNLARTLQAQGELRAAEQHYRKAIEFDPRDAGACLSLGDLLRLSGHPGEAEAMYRQAFGLCPDDPRVGNALGILLQEKGCSDEAIVCHRRALDAAPDNAATLSNLAQAQFSLGLQDEAEANFREALRLRPDIAMLHSNLLHFLTLNRAGSPETLAAHLAFGEQVEAPWRTHWPVHGNVRDPERTLRIGFVSADFHNHAVATFFEPLLVQLAGRGDLQLHAYYNGRIEDEVTRRLRGRFAYWNAVASLSDDALFETIRADGIDLLVVLSGHTAYNRLPVFARKPAPVQASWIGYPGTTGLHAIDYYLADRHFLPPGRFESQFTEHIAYLPANSPYLPPPEAPPVGPLPALQAGRFTFGSFARPNKIGAETVSLWARLLRAVPDADMLLGGMPESERGTLLDRFDAAGIARERLRLHPRCGMQAYLALHERVDVCLDTYPYNGGTTTLHALWMGVPTLTVAGPTPASRSGASILGHAGLESFVAQDADDFVALGVAWTNRLDELATLRAGLRERFLRSPRGQPALVAAGVARAFRAMWQRWCAGLPAATFEVRLEDIRPEQRASDA